MRYNFILLALLLINNFSTQIYTQTKLVKGCSGLGFFAEFLWVLNYLDYCAATGKVPVVFWDQKSSYYSFAGYNGSANAWEYYFEPVSHEKYATGDTIISYAHFGNSKDTFINHAHWNRPSAFWDYFEYIKFMHLCSIQERKVFKKVTNQTFMVYDISYPKGNKHIYSEQLRTHVKKNILDPFIKIKPNIQQKINNFYLQHMTGKNTIGIHLRGLHKYGEVPFVPISLLLAEANRYARNNVQFFVATDQISLLQQAQRELKGKVIFYECERFLQSTAPIPGNKLDPKLGENALIEAILLAQCNHFIHTVSHFSTAVLYFNPLLKHTVLY